MYDLVNVRLRSEPPAMERKRIYKPRFRTVRAKIFDMTSRDRDTGTPCVLVRRPDFSDEFWYGHSLPPERDPLRIYY